MVCSNSHGGLQHEGKSRQLPRVACDSTSYMQLRLMDNVNIGEMKVREAAATVSNAAAEITS